MEYFYLITAAIMLLSGLADIDDWPKLGTTAMILGLWCLYKGVSHKWQKNKNALDLTAIEGERAALLQENYNKAVDDYNAIDTARKQISDIGLSRRLSNMQHISGNMLRYLEKNPVKVATASKFIDYYQDRAAHLAQKYSELEQTGLNTPEVADMKERIKTAVGELETAYTQQFESVLNDQLIDMDAELKVLGQTMTADGVGQKRVNLSKATDGSFRPTKLPERIAPLSIIPADRHSDVLFTKIVQSALAIFLGGFGAHKFYQGKTLQGVLYFLFCWTAIPSFIGLGEGLRYLCMKMDDFYLEYYEPKKR